MNPGVDALISRIVDAIINPLILLMFGVALVVFLWGVFEFIRDAGSDEGRDLGKRHMLWGILGLAIMVSAFGILNLILNTIGVPSGFGWF